ncbi:MAG: Xaa-Pro dipeptidase [Candidatus Argoarchaeum ethanivorans]|uniref:Xaa-Pro dipeptidase n=1 Tax=Candidatus Argoarchaeum ethanivorans TaxID=2608793 RepID=A0A811TC49_9EURY|nr:MAG: Xaa-Pro dipeptidase [Candidatus Argoarchaeum ethanivorans]
MKQVLIDFIKKYGMDAYMIYADSARDSDLYYTTKFLAYDPFLYVHTREKDVLLISNMEAGRAEKQADVDEIAPLSRQGKEYPDVVADFVSNLGVQKIAVPRSFGLYLADRLRSKNIEVTPVSSPIQQSRSQKSETEISFIRSAQGAAEKAIKKAENTLKQSTVRDGTLYINKEVLTCEKLRSIIEVSLLYDGYAIETTIVAAGALSADPHNTGSGSIKYGEPIVIDVFPQNKLNRYHGDMTRTFVYGKPRQELTNMHEMVLAAQEAAIEMVKPGTPASEIHNLVCEVFESGGYDVGKREGFIHSTGHGVGLDVHELPAIGAGSESLKIGNVITIEPGLYYRDTGGVRIEDIVVVTENGCKSLNSYHKKLIIEGTE